MGACARLRAFPASTCRPDAFCAAAGATTQADTVKPTALLSSSFGDALLLRCLPRYSGRPLASHTIISDTVIPVCANHLGVHASFAVRVIWILAIWKHGLKDSCAVAHFKEVIECWASTSCSLLFVSLPHNMRQIHSCRPCYCIADPLQEKWA